MQKEGNFSETIAALCANKFSQLGKTGKPTKNEFILLACFVQLDSSADRDGLRVVALGTGSKCVGEARLPADGSVLHDSHAETVARRAFQLYLLHQIDRCLAGSSSIFVGTSRESEKLTLRDCLSYHFYTSQTPCGDASIIPLAAPTEMPVRKKLKLSDEVCTLSGEGNGVINDIHRTGAKVVDGEQKDELSSENYHAVGVLRTKPGRGDRTLSHCCSDKMFKWTVLGVQGAFVMLFIQDPIYLSSIVVGKGPYSEYAFYRALHCRFEKNLEKVHFPTNYHHVLPKITQANIDVMAIIHTSDNVLPSPTSIIWSDTVVHKGKHECSVNGKKLGVTKNNRNSPKANVSICRQEIARFVVHLLRNRRNLDNAKWNDNFGDTSYSELKKSSTDYNNFWHLLKTTVVTNWTVKPDIRKSFIVQ